MDITFNVKLPDLDKATDEALDQAALVLRKTALDIYRGVSEMSPVKSGLFRGNWLLSNNTPDSRIITGSGSVTPGHGAADATATARAMAALGSTSLTNRRSLSGVEGRSIYITNNLPYAQRLEGGWSKQAADGIVKPTLARFTQALT